MELAPPVAGPFSARGVRRIYWDDLSLRRQPLPPKRFDAPGGPRENEWFGHSTMDTIRMRGVRVHNLKGLDVEIPRGKLTVITGPSGSGKSSLAFDTLYAEGQRRYVESLSTYARQFLERVDRPDVDAIDGLPPAIAIQQKGTITSGRSTVGTATEIHDYLRLLYARIGRTVCTRCGREVVEESAERVVDRIEARGEGRLTIAFPLDPGKVLGSVTPAEFLADVRANGFQRILLDGKTLSIDDPEAAAIGAPSRLAVVVDRLVLKREDAGPAKEPPAIARAAAEPAAPYAPTETGAAAGASSGGAASGAGHAADASPPGAEQRRRIADAVETAYRFGHGRLVVVDGEGREERFSESLHCA